MTWREVTLEDIEFHVRVRPTAGQEGGGICMIDYEVRDLVSPEGPVFEDANLHPTTEIEDAPPLIQGQIKWDGCSHNYFGTEDMKTYMHGCSRSDMTRLGKLFDRLFDMAAELMPRNKDELA